jgi:hypothetical protein
LGIATEGELTERHVEEVPSSQRSFWSSSQRAEPPRKMPSNTAKYSASAWWDAGRSSDTGPPCALEGWYAVACSPAGGIAASEVTWKAPKTPWQKIKVPTKKADTKRSILGLKNAGMLPHVTSGPNGVEGHRRVPVRCESMDASSDRSAVGVALSPPFSDGR